MLYLNKSETSNLVETCIGSSFIFLYYWWMFKKKKLKNLGFLVIVFVILIPIFFIFMYKF